MELICRIRRYTSKQHFIAFVHLRHPSYGTAAFVSVFEAQSDRCGSMNDSICNIVAVSGADVNRKLIESGNGSGKYPGIRIVAFANVKWCGDEADGLVCCKMGCSRLEGIKSNQRVVQLFCKVYTWQLDKYKLFDLKTYFI